MLPSLSGLTVNKRDEYIESDDDLDVSAEAAPIVSIDARAGQTVADVMLGHLKKLRVANLADSEDGRVRYDLKYGGVVIGSVRYYKSMGYIASITHARDGASALPYGNEKVRKKNAKKMLSALALKLQYLGFAPVIRKVEWVLIM